MIEYNKKIVIAKTTNAGYLYFWDKEHPLATNGGLVYYHRHVASVKIGRWLNKNEQVHHKDGDKLNNDADNLDVLSLSEHMKIELLKRGCELSGSVHCKSCGSPLSNSSKKSKTKLCQNCYRLSTRKFNPTKEELEMLIWKYPSTKLAEMYGVSDRAIGKRCELLGISKPSRGYWQKMRR